MNEVNKVSHAELVTIAEEAKATGLFFTAEFIKKTDGTYRVMKSVRGGVARHTNGVGLKFDPSKKGLLVVWESLNPAVEGNEKYRMISLAGLKALVVGGKRYEVTE